MLDTDTCIFLLRGESLVLAAKMQGVPLRWQVSCSRKETRWEFSAPVIGCAN